MGRWGSGHLILVIAAVFSFGCSSAPSGQPSASSDGGRSAVAKRITAGILGEPYTLSAQANTAGTGSIRGVTETELLVNAGLSIIGGDGKLIPVLAEEVATLDDGRWKVFPDGRMETTWKLRAQARWHDGEPFTAEDLLFTFQVGNDKEVALGSLPGYQSLDKVMAPDAQTIVATWHQPFIDADQLFSPRFSIPLPKHLLGQTYQENKAGLLDLPYWTSDFIGTGPFRVTSFVRGS